MRPAAHASVIGPGAPPLPIRLRKLIGTIVLMIFIPVYCLFAAAVGDRLLYGAPGLAQAAYYVIAGLVWVLPAGVVVTWMVRPRPGELRNRS